MNSDCKNYSRKATNKHFSRNVEECLQADKSSNFKILKLNIHSNLFYKGNKRGEIGRTSFDQRNLPSHIDRIFTTFGLSKKDSCTCSDIIHGEYINHLTNDVEVVSYLPGFQVNRGYEHPYNNKSSFGKAMNIDVQGSKAKKLLYSFEKNLNSKNFNNIHKLSRDHLYKCNSRTKNKKTTYPSSIDEVLRQVPINWKLVQMKQCISYINTLRLQLKKRDCSECFTNLYNHFNCIDKRQLCIISLNEFYDILKEVNIKPDKEMFEFMLKVFNLILENSTVYYTDALNLLNWKCEFPSLPKFDDLPKDLQYYKTTYQDSMTLHY